MPGEVGVVRIRGEKLVGVWGRVNKIVETSWSMGEGLAGPREGWQGLGSAGGIREASQSARGVGRIRGV